MPVHGDFSDLRPVSVRVKTAARLMGISVATFYRRQGVPGFPLVYWDCDENQQRAGRSSYVRMADIDRWAAALPERRVGQ